MSKPHVQTAQHGASASQSVSIDPAEVEKFSRMADEWWDPRGKFAPLHRFNPTRLAFIRRQAERRFDIEAPARRPLEGLSLLDIGCGGGLLCEPMARLGARVTGVDASERNVKTAAAHAHTQGLTIDYRVGTAEGLLAAGEGPFDIVLNMEVVEHVADPARFLGDTARLVAPGGMMIVATLNRTPKAFALAIIGAEHLLRWLPVGTHDWVKFLRPDEVSGPLRTAGLDVTDPVGVAFNPLTGQWRLSKDTDVNYMVVGERAPLPSDKGG